MNYLVLLLTTLICGQNCAVVEIDATGCKNGEFTSPNWPVDYDNDLNMEWELTTDPGRHIVLSLDSFDVQGPVPRCHNDYLGFYEEGVPHVNDCGNATQVEYTTKTNKVLVVFHTNQESTRSGFRLLWHPVCDECPLKGCERISPDPTCISYYSCRWGYYNHEFQCGNRIIVCQDDCYACDGQTYSDCDDNPAYDPDICTMERETPCGETAGISFMLQLHVCERFPGVTYEVICSRPCCCIPLKKGPKPGPALHCGSPEYRVDQRETDCPGFRIDF